MEHQVITVQLQIDLSERGGHWHARVPQRPDVEVDGHSREEALLKAKALALRDIADRVESEQATSAGKFPCDPDW
jgi:predicted RNase H-like HicB family nuclease